MLLDVSASVTGRVLDELRRSLHQLRADLGPHDRLRLITFNMSIRRLVDFGQPTANLDEALASLRGTGSSAIFDSLAVALTAAAPTGAGSWSCSSATARTAAASATPTR